MADPFGIGTIQANVTAIGAAYTVIETTKDLPKAFGEITNDTRFVRSTLETARPTLENLKPAAYQIISPIAQKCLEDSTKVKKIFQELADKCNQNPDQKVRDDVRIWYLEAIGNDKDFRVECLTKRLLGNLKKICPHESVVAISLVKGVDEALEKLEDAGASLEGRKNVLFIYSAKISGQSGIRTPVTGILDKREKIWSRGEIFRTSESDVITNYTNRPG